MRRLAFIAFIVTLLPAASAQPPKKEPPKSQPDIVIQDRIVQGDAPDPFRKVPGKIHIVKLLAGKHYQIDMVSTEIDSSLRLESSSGERLAQDEDSGGGLNARILFTPAKEDGYKIYATTYAGGFGAYTLTVKEVAAIVGNKAVLGGPIPAAVKVVLTAERLLRKETLKSDDPRDPVIGHPAHVYELELDPSATYQVDLRSSQFDSYLRILDAKDKELARDDDSGGNLNARILFKPPVKGPYRIIATSFDGRVGDFELSVAPKIPIPTEKYVAGKTRTATKAGITLPSQLAGTDEKDNVRENCPRQIHLFEFAAGKTYVIEMTSSDVDAYLRLEDPSGKQLAEDDDSGGGQNARIRFRIANEGTYRIIATTFGPDMLGAYSLTVREE
jgi:hypothetical protein